MKTVSWCRSLPINFSKIDHYQSLQELIDGFDRNVTTCECPSIAVPIIWFFHQFKSNRPTEITGAYEAGKAHDITYVVTPELVDEIILKDKDNNTLGVIKLIA